MQSLRLSSRTNRLPTDLLADEKHVHFNSEKGYIATTVGADCVLGASLALTADETALTDAYGYFRDEAHTLDSDYTPQTVNTDGWSATQKAWQTLFPAITVIQCFLHAFLKIRNCTKKRYKALYEKIQEQVWDIYQAVDRQNFFRQVVDLQLWAVQELTGPLWMPSRSSVRKPIPLPWPSTTPMPIAPAT